jgi:lysophospholipase L1-like esterase
MRKLLPVALCVLFAGCAPNEVDEEGDEESEAAELNAEYAPGPVHSRITAPIADRLRAIVAEGGHRRDVFSKIGDSITVSTSFARCLSRTSVEIPAALAAADRYADEASLEATRSFFATQLIGQNTSFSRVSQAATVGWMAVRAIQGTPSSALDREIDTTDAAFAVVMFGTNDTWEGTGTQFRRNLRRIASRLLERRVVPILSTIPPRGQAQYDALVPGMNAIIRSVASYYRVPLMDYHQRLSAIPRRGLSGDGIHPNARGASSCDFSAAGLAGGYNQRNLLLIEALDRVKRVVLDGGEPDAG